MLDILLGFVCVIYGSHSIADVKHVAVRKANILSVLIEMRVSGASVSMLFQSTMQLQQAPQRVGTVAVRQSARLELRAQHAHHHMEQHRHWGVKSKLC